MYGIRINGSHWLVNLDGNIRASIEPIFITNDVLACRYYIERYNGLIDTAEIFEFNPDIPIQIINVKREKILEEIKRLCKEIGINTIKVD